jgi:hypothetical protein
MTAVLPATGVVARRPEEPDRYPQTLAGEHALLLRDVQRRAAPVVALLDARTWPHDELRALVAFLRARVLRQTSDEEATLYPHDATGVPFAELSADHVRLHDLTAELERVCNAPCPLPELRSVIYDLLITLGRHLVDEQQMLATLRESVEPVPAAARLAATDESWPGDSDEPRRVLLDTFSDENAVRACLERLLRLRTGERAEIRSVNAARLDQVRAWIRRFDPAGYGFSTDPADPDGFVLRVTRRPSG